MNKFDYNKYLGLRNYYSRVVSIISSIRLVIFVIMVVCFFVSSSYFYFMYVGMLLLILFIIFVFVHDKYYKCLDYYNKYIVILDEYKDRINGNWKKFEDNGIEYNNNLFSDLGIVGDNSLFQYISICKTKGSRDKLIRRLSNKKVSNSEILSSQKVVLELRDKIDFVVDYQVNMFEFRDKDIDFDDGYGYLCKGVGNKYLDLFVGIFFSFISLLLLLLGYLKLVSYNYFYGMFIFNFLINYMYSFIYRDEFEGISYVSSLYSKLNNVYKSVLGNRFDCDKLRKMYVDIDKSYGMVKRLEFIDNLNNLKNNILSSFIFNGLFCINIIVMFLYSKYQDNNVNVLKRGISSIEDISVYVSLASIGIVNDYVCIPDISDSVGISFKNIRHPLIGTKCVGNDFSGGCGVNIITGSNMGGKTTFIRTVGINLILFNAGTFVCADSFRSCYFKMFTSISVSDDISKGISTFYGELLRINDAIRYNDGNRLILVDEIFKGTNYNDRIYGAVNVIKRLNDKKTVMFVTTHDFELCDMDDENINNYYFKEYYEGDNIRFDYKMREGKCTSTNAKYLMKRLNIID